MTILEHLKRTDPGIDDALFRACMEKLNDIRQGPLSLSRNARDSSYGDAMRKNEECGICGFCDDTLNMNPAQELLADEGGVRMWQNISPHANADRRPHPLYADKMHTPGQHFLIIPRSTDRPEVRPHAVHLADMDLRQFETALRMGRDVLRKWGRDWTMCLRFGDIRKTGAAFAHMHFHAKNLAHRSEDRLVTGASTKASGQWENSVDTWVHRQSPRDGSTQSWQSLEYDSGMKYSWVEPSGVTQTWWHLDPERRGLTGLLAKDRQGVSLATQLALDLVRSTVVERVQVGLPPASGILVLYEDENAHTTASVVELPLEGCYRICIKP